MSIHKLTNRGGQYQVRWREGGQPHSKLFRLKGDAQAFERDVERRKALGPLAVTVIVSKMTLTEFVSEEWWPRYAIPNLAPRTRKRYLEIWSCYLHGALGGYELRQITPLMVEDLRAQLAGRGLGPVTIRQSMLLLSGIMRRAVIRELIPSNPVALVDKPKAPPLRRPEPLAPVTVERIRARLRQRDAALVSMLAYGGLRPGEAITARWGDLEDRVLHVQASKTGRARVVRLLSPLVGDLAQWRLASGRPGDRELIFGCEQIAQSRKRASEEWQLHDWQNWVRRIYQPAAIAAGVSGDMRAYRLRGSFVSLALYDGQSLTRVADQAGHSIATLAKHYAGVIEQLEDQPRVPAAEAIRQAREQATGQMALVAR